MLVVRGRRLVHVWSKTDTAKMHGVFLHSPSVNAADHSMRGVAAIDRLPRCRESGHIGSA
jgi:hypothetical protein